MAEREGLISLTEAVQRYGVARRTLYLWMDRHDLETFKFGRDRNTYLRLADVERLVNAEPERGRPGRWRQRDDEAKGPTP